MDMSWTHTQYIILSITVYITVLSHKIIPLAKYTLLLVVFAKEWLNLSLISSILQHKQTRRRVERSVKRVQKTPVVLSGRSLV